MVRIPQYFFFLIFHLPFRFFLKAQVRGIENIEKLKPGPYILVANHSAMIDPFLLAVLPLGTVFRLLPYYLPTTENYYSKWWIRAFIGPLGAYELKKKGWTLEEFLGKSKSLLESGRSLFLFPEGALTSKPYEKPVKPGFVYLPSETGVQVIPLRIIGVERLTLKSFIFRERSVVLSFGEPFKIPKVSINEYREIASEVLNKIYSL